MTAGTARLAEPERRKDTAGGGACRAGPPATVILLPTARQSAGAVRVPERVPGGRPVVRSAGRDLGGRPAVHGRGTPAAVPVVLTRRGRLVVTGFLALVAVGLLLVLPHAADATGAGVSPGRPGQNLSQVAVRPGDTLWSIAVRADPSADPRLVVQRITDLNALAGMGITPGRTLWVPKN